MNENDIEKKMQEVWEDHTTELPGYNKEALWQEFASQAFPAEKRDNKKWLYPAAAAIALFLTVGAFIFLNTNQPAKTEMAFTIIENPSAVVKMVTLPDSSVVELEPEAILRYGENFAENRNIKLTGKAFFNVHKDKKHPFTVQCHETTTTVLGTCFTVCADGEKSVKVALYEGSVKMSVKGKSSNWILSPGEEFTYKDGITDVAAFNRFIDFNDTELKQIVTYVKTTYSYTMQLPEGYATKKATLRINKRESLENIIEIIAQMYDLKPIINNREKKIAFE